MVPGLDDVRVEAQPVALGHDLELDLLDVEAELVQTAQTLLDPVPLLRAEHLLAGELGPERLVGAAQRRRQLDRVERIRELADLGLDVEQLAHQVLLGDQQVVLALAGGQLVVQLAGLGVDEVGGQRAGVAAEEGVRERAVAPEEAGEVEAHEQLRQPVEQARAQIGDAVRPEQRAVREREVEVTGDQDGLEVARASAHDADDLDDGDRLVGQPPQEAVLAPGEPLRQLLERVDGAVVVDEPNDVAADPAHDLDEALVLPALERLLPRQVEEVRMPRAREQLQLGRHVSPDGSPR